MKKKSLALLLAIAIVVVGAVAGTVAWLTDQTPSVTNTFTTSDINIELKETKNNFQMIPGWNIEKDPKVTVKAGSEACYLFVKLEKSANFDTFMTYEMAEGWTALPGNDGVFYREVAAATADTTYEVLRDNQVTVKDEVTKAQMNDLTADTYPTLTVTAYASQLNQNATTKFAPAEAWDNITP
mgnify:FL=1